MAGERSDGRPQQRDGQPPAEAMTGGLSGGEWWRVEGPWRVLGSAQGVAEPLDEDDGVYAEPVPQVPAQAEPAAPAAATVPAAVEGTGWVIAPAVPGPGRAPTLDDFPGWSEVRIEFPPDDTVVAEPAEPKPVPDQRTGEEAEPAAAPAAPSGRSGRALLAGRRPSPLLLLSSGVLVGGAVSGLILVLLAGWGLAWLSGRLGDLTKKFAVFGIPLVTMSASSLWFWGRSEGRWGAPLPKGSAGHEVFASAPGVLRLAGVLTALFLLAVALRRRKEA
jgi:hypothetical protein